VGRGVALAALLVVGAGAAPAAAATRWVCAHGRPAGCLPRIQQAVDVSRPGDTVRVPAGTYREAVRITGRAKRGLQLIGDPRIPAHVRLEGGGRRTVAVLVDDADGVVVRGFSARRYTSGGFVARRASGFAFRNLVATHTGDRGFSASRVRGGSISDSAASQNRWSGFAVSHADPPVALRGVSGFLNPTGLRGTDMQVSASVFFNNGVGIVAGAGRGEIADNDIFWNNFDYLLGAPFAARDEHLPLGTGILLRRGSAVRVTGNRIFGQFLSGAAAAEEQADDRFAGNGFGFNGLAEDPAEDRNAVDVAFGARPMTDPDRRRSWARHEHPEIEGFDPVERWRP
jgi:hypothetical protein